MSIDIRSEVVMGGALLEGRGYVVSTEAVTFGVVCTKCIPVWQPDDQLEDEPFDSRELAMDVIRAHDQAEHR